jgi:hypothetical protein
MEPPSEIFVISASFCYEARAPVGRNTIDRERLRAASGSTQIKLAVTATPSAAMGVSAVRRSIPQRFPSPMTPAPPPQSKF